MDAKALFFDIDGTLAMNSNPPSDEDIKAIRRVRKEGHKVFLCTGRSCGYLYKSILEVGFDGIISGAGARVTVGNDIVFRRYIEPRLINKYIDLFFEHNIPGVLEGERGMFGFCSARDVRPYESKFHSKDEYFKRFSGEVISKFSVYMPIPYDIIEQARVDFTAINMSTYYELLPKGCSKAGGVKAVLNHLGLSERDAVCFGDSMNDYDMIKLAGTGVAMGNAISRLKNEADEVTDTVDNSGVAKWLNKNLLGECL